MTEVKQLKNRAEELAGTIQELRESDTYQTIQKVGDWNTYFNDQQNNLKNEIDRMNAMED